MPLVKACVPRADPETISPAYRFDAAPPAKADAESRFDAKSVPPAVPATSAAVDTAASVAPAISPLVTAVTREGDAGATA